MILSDTDILRRLEQGDLEIDPLTDIDQQVQPCSVDLRLGNTFLEFNRTQIPCIHPNNVDEVNQYVSETHVNADREFILHPGEFALATTIESVTVPDDLVGHVEGRSSLGRLAIIIHATAGLADAGYSGQITLELSNLGAAPVALSPGMRISQITFTQMTSPAERPYGTERGSKYQGQSGPEPSRIGDDPEFSA
jgi:dCTP deaminase